MKKLLGSVVIFLLLTGSLYAANGDLTVMGNLGVGIDAPDSGCETCKGKFLLHNPTRPWTYFRLSNSSYTHGYIFGIDGGDAAHFAYDGMGISFIANSGAPNRGAGYWTRMHKDGRLTIGEYWPASQLSVYGTTPISLTGTVTVTNGSSTLTGNGTLFAAELKPGSAIHINDGKQDQWGQVEGRTYTVTAIASNISLTINNTYSGATASGLTAERDSSLFGIYSASKVNKLLVTQDGNLGIGTTNPQSRLAVNGLPTAPPDGSGNKGIVCITNDGNMWIDTNSGDGICN